MKHLIFFICALFACINTTKAQSVTISTSDLDSTKWQTARQYDSQSKVYYEYTRDKEVWHQSDGDTFAYPYYLSKSKPTKYDDTKVGVITQGCYLVELNPKWGTFSCYSIKYFNKKEGTMVLTDMDEGTTLTYILIPSNKPRNQSANTPILKNW